MRPYVGEAMDNSKTTAKPAMPESTND